MARQTAGDIWHGDSDPTSSAPVKVGGAATITGPRWPVDDGDRANISVDEYGRQRMINADTATTNDLLRGINDKLDKLIILMALAWGADVEDL